MGHNKSKFQKHILDNVPLEVVETIFCFLAPTDLQNARLVCKLWNELISSTHSLIRKIHEWNYNKQVCVRIKEDVGDDYNYLFKFSLKGDPGVGKTSLILRFVDDTFSSTKQTISTNFRIATVKFLESVVKLQIWDERVQLKFRYNPVHERQSHAILVAFSVTDRTSFENIKHWMKEIDRYMCSSTNTVLVGTFADDVENRKVTFDEAKALADELEVKYVETSAKTGLGVNEAFSAAVKAVKERVSRYTIQKQQVLVLPVKEKKKQCCVM